MNIFLVAGPDPHAVQSVWQTLQGLGVYEVSPSHRDGLLPQDIHQMMGESLVEITTAVDVEITSDTPKPMRAAWRELAADLWLANLQHPMWGWHMSNTAHLLDYWLDFDPHILLVLAYNTPAEYLQQQLLGISEISPQLVEKHLVQWSFTTETLLAQYYAASPRCVLVHSGTVVYQPGLLSESMSQQWGIQLTPAATDQSLLAATPPCGVDQYLMTQIISSFPATGELLQELEATAHVPSYSGSHPEASVFQLWTQHIAAQQQAQLQATQASEKITQFRTQLNQARTEGDQKLVALTDAYESLLLQLDEAQQETEHYFLLNQNATEQLQVAQQVSNFWQRNAPGVITVNLCNDIDGSNWYHAEDDGRWAGPGVVSTLQMPPVLAGYYVVELMIQDAMQPEIVVGMQLGVVSDVGSVQSLDLVHDFSQDSSLYPMVSSGAFDLATQHHSWVLQMSLPGNHCPAEAGGNDTRRLGLKLKTLRLSRQ